MNLGSLLTCQVLELVLSDRQVAHIEVPLQMRQPIPMHFTGIGRASAPFDDTVLYDLLLLQLLVHTDVKLCQIDLFLRSFRRRS